MKAGLVSLKLRKAAVSMTLSETRTNLIHHCPSSVHLRANKSEQQKNTQTHHRNSVHDRKAALARDQPANSRGEVHHWKRLGAHERASAKTQAGERFEWRPALYPLDDEMEKAVRSGGVYYGSVLKAD